MSPHVSCGIVLLAVVAVATACVPGAPGYLANRRECPHAWVGDSTDSLHRALEDNVDLVKPIINVPEFHDCQRFLSEDRRQYLPFFAVLASWRLDSLLKDLQVLQPPPSSVVTPPGGNVGGSPTITTPAATPGSQSVQSVWAVPVAEIYAEGDYKPLGIRPWLNCLYLTIRNGEWVARMIPKGGKNVRCGRQQSNSIGRGTDLDVRAAAVSGFNKETDYPAVARWDWDSTTGTQYVGIKCGAAWCEIGRKGFQSSAALPTSAGDSRDVQRVRLIKGWYDQQFLAKADPNNSTVLVPSTILGTVIPDPRLGSHDGPTAFASGPVPVATVALVPSSSVDNAAMTAYENKFNFSRATVTAPNVVTLCNDLTAPWGNCVNTWSAANGSPIPPITTASTCAWWAIVHRADGQMPSHIARCVVRYAAPATLVGPSIPTTPAVPLIIPGTSRWRWMKDDEGNWYRCTQGCCEMRI